MTTFDLNTDLFNYADKIGLSELHLKIDPETGLKAIIAIHNTNRGPALGGCRCIEYNSESEAFFDAMRLAEGMSYKAALSNLPYGGGKSVILKPKHITDRKKFFQAFGRFIHELNGKYITAEDSGVSPADMDVIATVTPYVVGTSHSDGTTDDPSPHTALGTFFGMEAALKHKMGHSNFQNLHIAIQGVGAVGFKLAKILHQKGARLTVCDKNTEATARCKQEFNADVVDVADIHKVKCDIYSPCAYGAILNDRTIPELQTSIIAGCANNQLHLEQHGFELQKRGILYAPDYVVNAGGLIFVGCLYNKTMDQVEEKLREIQLTLFDIFTRADKENLPPNVIADRLARERVKKSKPV